MKKSMKILLAVVLVLAMAVGFILYAFGPSMKLSTMMQEAWTAPDRDFTLTLNTPENELMVKGSYLTSLSQTEARFLTMGGQEITRVVVDGQTAYLDFWPLFDALGKTFFEFIEIENPMDQVPDVLRQSGLIALELNRCSEERNSARMYLLTIIKDSFMPDLLDEAEVTRGENGGVLVTWESEKLAAVFERAGERLNVYDRELYVQWTELMKGWGSELNGQDSLMVRMMGKLMLSMVRKRENNQAQGVAELHDHVAEHCAALADQVKEYGSPELQVWKDGKVITQELTWTTGEGDSRFHLETSPGTRSGVELPGTSGTPEVKTVT